MAIALDAVARSSTGAAATFSWTHTVAGADRIIVVAVAIRNTGSQTVTGVTYAGVAMTKTDGAAADMTHVNTTNIRVEMWKLVAPVTGSNSVVVTLSASASAACVSSSWTDVHQTVPLGTWAEAASTNAAPTVTVSAAANDVVVDVLGNLNNALPTVGAGQTLLRENPTGVSIPHVAHSQEAGAASVVMSWTLSASDTWATGGVALKPTAGAAAGTLDATTTIAELSIVPRRAGPSFANTVTTSPVLDNAESFEASGMLVKVLRGKRRGDRIIWDDIYTLPGVSDAGQITVAGVPADNSPNTSLFVASRDEVVQLPLPDQKEPSVTAYPQLARDATNQIAPVYYPSAVDLSGLHELRYVHCEGADFTTGADSWAMSFRWDDTNPWEAEQRQTQGNVLFEVSGENQGTVLHTAFQILDSVATDPIGPTGRRITAWVKPHDDHPALTAPQVARTSPETS